MSELPKGWEDIELRDLVGLAHTGLVRSAKDQSDEFEFPYLKMNNLSINGRFLLDKMTKVNATPPEVGKFTLERGDFLFNTRNSVELVGKCGVYQGSVHDQVLFNNNLLKIKLLIVLPEIIAHWFNSALGKKQLSEITSATTSVAAIYQKALMTRRVPVPPLAEQKRIVEKLDEVLAQVDTIKARLDGIPDLLKRFRQSVLASAVSGKLTEEWRGSHIIESQQVDSILESRKDLWVKNEERKLREKNNSPFVKWKGKYKTPSVDPEEKFNTPDTWLNIRADVLSFLITDGKHGDCSNDEESGYYFISAKDIFNGKINYSNARQINSSEFREVHFRTNLELGDVLVTNAGTIGRVAVATEELMLSKTTFQKSVAVIKLVKNHISSKYFALYLEAGVERLKNKSSGTAVKNLLLRDIRDMSISLPSIAEQKEIVRLVDQYFAFADTIEAQVKKAQARVDNLTQSILAKAFRGELVAQDPTDEPADKLLERIAEARKEAEALAKAAKKAEAAKKKAEKAAAKG
ncbi:restriction endonuclease subunit S [Vibrio splendidus]